jgi:hypothetical protein
VREYLGGIRRPAVPAQVGDDQPELLREACGERLPILPATAEAVQKNERFPAPRSS